LRACFSAWLDDANFDTAGNAESSLAGAMTSREDMTRHS
jgi:hypothetical protein